MSWVWRWIISPKASTFYFFLQIIFPIILSVLWWRQVIESNSISFSLRQNKRRERKNVGWQNVAKNVDHLLPVIRDLFFFFFYIFFFAKAGLGMSLNHFTPSIRNTIPLRKIQFFSSSTQLTTAFLTFIIIIFLSFNFCWWQYLKATFK